MGGNAFPTPAARLTTAQHTALLAYIQSTLGGVFGTVSAPSYPKNKTSHGDLDVICGWAGASMAPAKGRGKGAPCPGDICADITLTSPPKEVDAWCAALAHAVRGTAWTRSGGEVSIAVPASVLEPASDCAPDEDDRGTPAPPPTPSSPAASPFFSSTPRAASPAGEVTAEVAAESSSEPSSESAPSAAVTSDAKAAKPDPEPFFQVDLFLTPPSTVPFAQFSYSYGTTILILSHYARHATTHGVTMQMGSVLLRTRPFPTLRTVDTYLSSDPHEVCTWLGLDYNTLGEQYDSIEGLFAWFATGTGPRADRALRRLAHYGVETMHNDRMVVVDAFGGWLRENGWGDLTPRSPKEAKQKLPQPELDLDNPTPLGRYETKVLEYWGKVDEYNAQVEELRDDTRAKLAATAKKKEDKERERLEAEKLAEAEGGGGDASQAPAAQAPLSATQSEPIVASLPAASKPDLIVDTAPSQITPAASAASVAADVEVPATPDTIVPSTEHVGEPPTEEPPVKEASMEIKEVPIMPVDVEDNARTTKQEATGDKSVPAPASDVDGALLDLAAVDVSAVLPSTASVPATQSQSLPHSPGESLLAGETIERASSVPPMPVPVKDATAPELATKPEAVTAEQPPVPSSEVEVTPAAENQLQADADIAPTTPTPEPAPKPKIEIDTASQVEPIDTDTPRSVSRERDLSPVSELEEDHEGQTQAAASPSTEAGTLAPEAEAVKLSPMPSPVISNLSTPPGSPDVSPLVSPMSPVTASAPASTASPTATPLGSKAASQEVTPQGSPLPRKASLPASPDSARTSHTASPSEGKKKKGKHSCVIA